MTGAEHIAWEEILDAIEAEGALPAPLQRHLESCARCAEQYREARNLLGALEIAASPDPSPELLRATMRAVRKELRAQTAARTAGRAVEALKEIWASLASGSLAPSHAVRGGDAAASPMVLYEAGEFVVSISLKPHDPLTQNLLGKVVPKSDSTIPPGTVSVWIGEQPLEAELGPHGMFRFDRIPRGAVRVDLRFGDLLIHLPEMGPAGREE